MNVNLIDQSPTVLQSLNVAFQDLLITEIFHSLQGETSLSGVPFAFIRLTGCNLRCTYCDSAYAFKGGEKLSIDQIVDRIRSWKVKHVLLTGGEPLLQRNTPALAERLRAGGYLVSVETHGEVSIEKIRDHARVVMDIKTPSSGMNRGGWVKNVPLLRAGDEVKFVIASKDDLEYAVQEALSQIPEGIEILFSPAVSAPGSPGHFEGVSARWLAEEILSRKLPVRFQMQLHKLLWPTKDRGI